MCAGEALIQAMMGIVCDSYHKPLLYDPKATDYTMKNGIYVSKNKKVFNLCNQRLMDNTGRDLPSFQKQVNDESKARRAARAAKALLEEQKAKAKP